uniref:RGS domain-containing protein n=1 Tax=Panagrellus redivivus TaxID=6233 RepID=A0A7E4VXK3_PANRE
MAPEPVSDNDMNPIENVQPPASPPTPGVKRTVTFAPRPASEAAPKRPRQTPAREISDPTKFGKYAVFKQFLEVLLRNFSNELSRFKTPRDIKFFLADRPVMKPFQDLLMNDNFVTQWILLHNKCDPFPNAANTMETAAREIEFGLENKGSLIQHFADFPAKPQDNDVEDMARCIKEIMVMRNLGQSLYNINQKNYLKGFQSILKRKREKLLLNNSHNLPDVIQSRSSTYENGTSRAESVTVPQRSRAASLVPARDSPDGGSEIMTAIDYFMKENPNIPKADVFREFSYLAREARNRYEKMAEAASGNTY